MTYSHELDKAIKLLKSAKNTLFRVDLSNIPDNQMRKCGTVLDELDEIYTQLQEVKDGTRNFISSPREGHQGRVHSNSSSPGRDDS